MGSPQRGDGRSPQRSAPTSHRPSNADRGLHHETTGAPPIPHGEAPAPSSPAEVEGLIDEGDAEDCMPLWQDQSSWSALLTWVKGREGHVTRFYKDGRGYVTIGYGLLVDVPDGSETQARIRAQRFAREWHRFVRRRRGHRPVTEQQIVADWHSVYSGRRRLGLIELSPEGMDATLEVKLKRFAGRLYATRNFARCLPAPLQMALIDTAYNPGPGNNLFIRRNARHPISQMWAALDPFNDDPDARRRGVSAGYDPERALRIFDTIWRRIRSPATYPSRHRWRLEKFREGIDLMAALRQEDRRPNETEQIDRAHEPQRL